jgi:valyl-tRNA synthetase
MLASMAAPGTDIALTSDRIEGGRNFANKIWNAARFAFSNLEKIEGGSFTLEELAAPEIRAKAPYPVPGEGALAHQWIFSRLACVTGQVNTALESFRFHEACQTIYQFFWGDFCDWYIEWVKPQLADPNREVAVPAWRNIFAALDNALRLLHPVMPFLTEELWHKLPQPEGARSIALDKFPEPLSGWANQSADDSMMRLQEIIVAARNIRAEMKLDPKKKVPAEIWTGGPMSKNLIRENMDPLVRLAYLSELVLSPTHLEATGGAIRSTSTFDLRIAYVDTSDKPAEIARLKKEIARLEADIDSKQKRLADDSFTSKAPGKIVDDLRATMVQRQIELKKLRNRLEQLEA